MSNVGIVIITFRTDVLLAELLSQLVNYGTVVSEIVVVDNAMSSNTRRVVESQTREASVPMRYLEMPNPGYGSAANAGILALCRSDVALVCNADILIEQSSIQAMGDQLLETDDLAIVAPVLASLEGEEDLWSDARFPTLGGLLLTTTHLHKTPMRRLAGRFQPARDLAAVEWLSGAVMMLRVSDWEQGLRFDERYFMYMEDVDICRQAAARGRGVSICSSAVAQHVGGASSPSSSKRVYVHSRLAKLLYAAKWAPRSVKVLRLIFFLEASLKSRWPDGRAAGPRLWLELGGDMRDGDLVGLQYDSRVVD